MVIGEFDIPEFESTKNLCPLNALVFNKSQFRIELWDKHGLRAWHNYTPNLSEELLCRWLSRVCGII